MNSVENLAAYSRKYENALLEAQDSQIEAEKKNKDQGSIETDAIVDVSNVTQAGAAVAGKGNGKDAEGGGDVREESIREEDEERSKVREDLGVDIIGRGIEGAVEASGGLERKGDGDARKAGDGSWWDEVWKEFLEDDSAVENVEGTKSEEAPTEGVREGGGGGCGESGRGGGGGGGDGLEGLDLPDSLDVGNIFDVFDV